MGWGRVRVRVRVRVKVNGRILGMFIGRVRLW